MSQNEQTRLNEIIFCKLFQQLLKQHVNPIKVYDLIAAVAAVTDANILVLNSVMTTILNNDRQYMFTKQEYAYLLKQSSVSVRRTCKLAGISPNTYYAISPNDLHTEPRFTPIQYAEMMKILQFFNNAYQNMEGSTV
jgi:hypothetical protein